MRHAPSATPARMRDVVAGAQHGMVNDVAYEARGQIVLGVEGVAALN